MSSESDPQSSGSPVFFLLMISLLLAVWGFVTDVINTGAGGSIDLRNRVTGVRVAAEHKDPYTYKWARGDSDKLFDPFDPPSSPVGQPTVTPTTLALFLPFKELNYRVTQWIWLLVQYAALGLGIFAWLRSSGRQVWAWGGILTCLYCLTPHWRLHVDRGQSYVLYAALLLGMAALRPAAAITAKGGAGGKRKGSLWLEGLLAALLTLLRPTFGLLLGISAARRKMTALLSAAIGLLIGALLPVLLAGPAIWRNYFSAMDVRSRLYLKQVKFPPARFSAKEVVEGIPIDKFLHFPRIPFSDTSLYRLVSYQLSPKLLLGSWALLAALAGWTFLRRRELGTPRFWWAVSAWIYLGDFALPAYRYNYNHILLWPMLLLGLNALTERARLVWMILSSALLVLHSATWWLPNACIPWPGVASLLLAAGVVVATALPIRGRSSETSGLRAA